LVEITTTNFTTTQRIADIINVSPFFLSILLYHPNLNFSSTVFLPIYVRFHDLKHTCATRMIEKGANIVTVSKILGHSDVKITMRYAHPESSLVEAVEFLNSSSKVSSRLFNSNL